MTKRKSFKIIILTIIVALLLLSTIGVVLAESAGYMTDYVFFPDGSDLFSNFKGVMPGDELVQDIRPVSYTHLDVYKRQLQTLYIGYASALGLNQRVVYLKPLAVLLVMYGLVIRHRHAAAVAHYEVLFICPAQIYVLLDNNGFGTVL